jgi:hypothetical protein
MHLLMEPRPRHGVRRKPRIIEEITMSKPIAPRQSEEMGKKKPGNLQDANPPKKTSTDNPERNPRDQKGRGGSK